MQVRVLEVLEEPDDGKLSDTVCPVEAQRLDETEDGGELVMTPDRLEVGEVTHERRGEEVLHPAVRPIGPVLFPLEPFL